MLNADLSNFDFKVPENLIAIHPVSPRHNSKLVVVSNKEFNIYKFSEIIKILNPGDCLVVNDTKVIPGRFVGKLRSKIINFTLNKNLSNKTVPIWEVLVKPLKLIKLKDVIMFKENIKGKIVGIDKTKKVGLVTLRFNCSIEELQAFLNNNASLALPNYIVKKRSFNVKDKYNYQTVFAKNAGAIAAPTASLHFSNKMLNEIKKRKIQIIKVTLHVNGGTFLPIKSKNINEHIMHYEFGRISNESAQKINTIRKKGNKIIAVGTTVLRLLETAKNRNGSLKEFEGETNIFIKPGWKVNSIDGLITNFHTPKSTLFVLICSIIGIRRAIKLYNFAIKNKLRFHSYGDCCLIWN